MQKTFLLFIAALLILCGCNHQSPLSPTVTVAPAQTTVETTQTIPPTAPEHSDLYIPGVPVEDVIRYFNEVCLDAEFENSGDASLVQKWSGPVYYRVSGDPTQEDLAVLEGFADWLNGVEGFPGIRKAEDDNENLQIYFCSQDDMLSYMGESFSGLDGAVTFWYEENSIYNAIICCRNDIDQPLRNSVILEEIYNGLGPIQDTGLREDSIIYSGFSQPQALTEIDELLIKILYHPQINCGMDAAQCESVIRELYY